MSNACKFSRWPLHTSSRTIRHLNTRRVKEDFPDPAHSTIFEPKKKIQLQFRFCILASAFSSFYIKNIIFTPTIQLDNQFLPFSLPFHHNSMPPVDLETLVCGGTSNDRKIGCEPVPPQNLDPHPENPVIRSDDPAESYLVSKEDEVDWFDRHAFFDRKGSTKGSENIPSFVTSSVTISKRYVVSLKSKASIIGLPKTHDGTFDSKLRRPCKPMHNPRFFPKRSRSSGGKSIAPLSEPGSPKVSCIGRVRSKKDRSRRRRAQLKKEVKVVPVVVAASKPEKKGLWKVLKSALKIGGGRKIRSGAAVDTVTVKRVPSKRMVTSERDTDPAPPELSGLNRFASGRRSESWASYDVDLEMDEQISLSPPDNQSGSVWSRRGVGPVGVVSVERRWENAGPASV